MRVNADTYEGEWIFSTILEDRAARFGDRTFIRTHEASYSYAHVCDSAARIASGLRSLRLRSGAPVANMLDTNTDHIFTWFGCAWAGKVEVPINTEFGGAFLEHVLNESQAAALVIDAKYVSRLASLNLPHLEHVVVAGRDAAGPTKFTDHRLDDWYSADPAPREHVTERDGLYVLYTSGTTGPSKGVLHCNRSALWTARVWNDRFELTSEDVGYSFFPLFHTTARNGLIADALIAGAEVAVRERFSLSEFWQDVDAFGATYIAYMGAVVQMLWNRPASSDDGDHSLRVGGGAAAPPAIVADFEDRFGMTLLEVYGMTEIGPASVHRLSDRVRGTMGKPVDHLEVAIHDENDNPRPPETAGEIVVRPREPWSIMQGYWNNPEATVAAWRNLWFHTGDLGKMTADGNLVYLDRLKDSLRRRGENISSFEVERAINTHPSVTEVAVYAVPSELTEDDVMAAVVLLEGCELDPAEFFGFCEENLPRFAVPTYVRVVEKLPTTPTERVEKFRLRNEGVTPGTHIRPRRSGLGTTANP